MLCTCIYKTLSFYCDVKEGGGGSGLNVIMTLSVAKISLEMLPNKCVPLHGMDACFTPVLNKTGY